MAGIADLQAGFAAPSARYRALPFWSWNGKLERSELLRQIEAMQEQGMGGFFMHAREGLETPYMGEEWMEAVRASVRQAEALGMQAWLYDEDRWPSGTAGGQVPAQGDAYRAKGLTLETVESGLGVTADATIVAAYTGALDGLRLIRSRRLEAKPGDVLRADPGESLFVLRIEVSAPSEWFNGETPPDSLNPDTVRAFIRASYEPYREAVGEQFGRAIGGMFTDEPSVHDRHCRFTPGRGWLPWGEGFADFFRERRGYDPFDRILYVFYDGDEDEAIRHDYWRTVAERFCEAYTRQIGQWCESHGLAFTGHYLWENALGVATRTGGAIMPHYRYQHVPGIDMLCEQTDEYMTVKQCTSVANQFGRPFVLSETYGCAGWAFTFEGQKWVGDWQYALGVNIRSQHLAMYTIRGLRKRDYPPFFGYQTTWWPYARVIEDYFARIGAVMTDGVPLRGLLVLHPASTAWSMLGTHPRGSSRRAQDRTIPEVDRYGDAFNQLLKRLSGEHYDYDLGDETMMAESAEAEGRRLRIGVAMYDTILLPPMRTLLRSTVQLLESFLARGGTVIALRPLPTRIEGREDEALGRLLADRRVKIADSFEGALAELEIVLPRPVRLRDETGREVSSLLCLCKRVDDGYTVFVTNNDRERGYTATIELPAEGRIEEWDPLTGESRTIDACGRSFQVCFGPSASKLYVLQEAETAEAVPAEGLRAEVLEHETAASSATAARRRQDEGAIDVRAQQQPAERKLLSAFGPAFEFERTMPNVLTLDRCAFRIGQEAWSEPMEVWQAQAAIRERLGMRPTVANGLEQRYKWIGTAHPADGTPIMLRLTFQVERVPEGEVRLALEEAGAFRVLLNGAEQAASGDGWFMDRELPTLPLRGLLQGDNVLELSCAYNQAMELEDCYLIGDFGVSASRAVIAEPKRLLAGDWGLQGYLHYPGGIRYRMPLPARPEAGRRVVLEAGEFAAALLVVRIGDQLVGYIPWRAADGLDVTDFMGQAGQVLEIEAVGTPRNMLGPFHDAAGDGRSTDWSAFRTEGSRYTPDYITRPYGLLGQVKLWLE